MNLHNIARGAIRAVNPEVLGTIRQSTGYTTDAAYKQVPTYRDFPNVRLQVQGMQWKDLRQVDSLNLQGIVRKVFVTGDWGGVIRARDKGGDLIVIKGETWLVVQVLETWADWSSFVIVLQQPVAS